MVAIENTLLDERYGTELLDEVIATLKQVDSELNAHQLGWIARRDLFAEPQDLSYALDCARRAMALTPEDVLPFWAEALPILLVMAGEYEE
ncbi:MAG: hypothetical protein L3J79_04640, partial [Candidatus Marinimicrobia bacterium]|nr:hypothetical protein [Candidatus Neomarinimicrobiota bacterium]